MMPTNDSVIAAHLLATLFRLRERRTGTTAQSLAAEVGIRRRDVRRVLSALHREGKVDVLTMRLTLSGLAIGAALASRNLRQVARTPRSAVAA